MTFDPDQGKFHLQQEAKTYKWSTFPFVFSPGKVASYPVSYLAKVEQFTVLNNI